MGCLSQISPQTPSPESNNVNHNQTSLTCLTQGLVWQISPSFVTTPVRGVTTESKVCPDDTRLQWEWYNTTTSQHQQLYIGDTSIKLKCNY